MESNMKSVLRNYVKKCGEGRNLDKFLRRNSISSDERETSSSITTSKVKTQTKSLESLLDESKRIENSSKSNQKSPKLPKTPPKKEQEAVKNCPMEPAKVVVKQSGEKVDKKKQFNYESIIEITLPQPQQVSQFLPLPIPEMTREKSSIDDKLEEPIEPVIFTPKNSKIPQHSLNSEKKLSPSSGNESSVSNKQNPMEWDTFIPGYETENFQENMQCNQMELGDNELNALKTYFHQRGLELPNENIIVVIKNRQEKLSEKDKRLEHIRKNKEKWQNIYEKYKVKYQQSSSINFEDPDAQSTPRVPDNISISKIIESDKTIMNEKGSQTSLVKSSVKSIQTAASEKCSESKNAAQQTTLKTNDDKTRDPFETYHNQSETAESFVFVRGPTKEHKQKKLSHAASSSRESNESRKSSSVLTEAGSSKHSGLSMSNHNEEISNFDDSLKVAIALLNSLLESNMRPELKRNLAEKVIQKITQLQTSKSIQTSTMESSGFYAVESSHAQSESKSSSGRQKTVENEPHKELPIPKRSRSREEALKDCLKPITKSEMSHQNSLDDNTINKDSAASKKSVPKNQLMDFVKREKQSQLKWIEKEIDHLNNLRDLLKRNETPIPFNESSQVYANVSSLKDKEEQLPNKEVKKIDSNFYNSHANMKKSRNRSKIETPQSDNGSKDESLASFIDNRNRKFLETYTKHQKHLYEDANSYTNPYSKESKRDIVSKQKHNTKKTQMTANKDVQTSTSLASSSVFESSDSMSVPINSNSKTTTHYRAEPFSNNKENTNCDNSPKTRQKVAVTQTTDSICRTRPIYEIRCKENDAKYGTTSTTVTQRVKKLQNDKQLQTQPPSIKYTLTFDKKSKPKIRQYASLPQKQFYTNEYTTVTKSSKDIYNQISYTASLSCNYEENKENYGTDALFDNEVDEEIDIRECFNRKHPEILSRFEQRRKCIDELKKLRALRNEHRAKLLLLTSEKSLEGKLFSSLPELPLRRTRIFSTKALKLQTKRVVRNLSEVQQKKKEENIKNLKRKTRLMTDIFNKNLQRNVLRGNLNLSNTVNLITK